MTITQWVIFAVITLLLFSSDKNSQFSAVVLVVAYLFYQSFIVGTPLVIYYSYAAFLNLIVGVILHKRNPYAAIAAYSLALCNVAGFVLWLNYYEHHVYDNISLLILILQTIIILPTRLLNGLRHIFINIKRVVLESRICNSYQARVTLYKSHPTKETRQ